MIMGRYARFLDADLMFGLNIIFIVVLFAIIFTYADRTKIIEEDLIKNKKNIYATLIIISVLTFIVTGLNYSIPGHYIYLYLIIPIISSVRDIMYRKKWMMKSVHNHSFGLISKLYFFSFFILIIYLFL